MSNFVLEVIESVGGPSIIAAGVGSLVGSLICSRNLQKQQARLNVEIEKYKVEFDVLKSKGLRYSESQFTLYNELWVELYLLDNIGNNLRKKATQKDLQDFCRQLRKTMSTVKKNALLIEESHLKALLEILNQFRHYEVNKKQLLEVRTSLNASQYEIDKLIEENRKYKKSIQS